MAKYVPEFIALLVTGLTKYFDQCRNTAKHDHVPFIGHTTASILCADNTEYRSMINFFFKSWYIIYKRYFF